MNLLFHVGLPPTVRKALDPVIDESIAKALENEADAAKREQAATLLKALAPTFKSGEVDLAFSLRGPSKDNHYAVVLGLKLEDGQAIDKAVRNFLQTLPENNKAAIKVDAESAGEVKSTGSMPRRCTTPRRRRCSAKTRSISPSAPTRWC